jgi:(p)ppGpp synthase/HD superfamily hydrolase
MNNMLTESSAKEFAREKHWCQVDKLGQPYFGHCERVAARLRGDYLRSIAYLHDVMEDTDTTIEEIIEVFGPSPRAIEALKLLTHKKSQSYQAYIQAIAACPDAREVKLADIWDNLDPLRLSELPCKTQGRLLVKYGSALRILGEK